MFIEHLYIIMKKGISRFKEENIWNIMISKIKTISVMKTKEHGGLTNKSLFKFMDIIDIKE